MDFTVLFITFLVGIAGGVISGLLGVGGGIVYILILPWSLEKIGISSVEIVPYIVTNSIFATFFAALINNYLLIRSKFFFLTEVLLTSMGSIFTSLLVYFIILPQSWYSKSIFNVVVIIIIVPTIVQLLKTKVLKREENQKEKLPFYKFTLAGTAGGLITTLSGIGGGLIMIPIMNLIMKLNLKKAASISLGVIAITSFIICLINFIQYHSYSSLGLHGYHLYGFLVLEISASLVGGVFLGAPIGNYLAKKTSVPVLKKVFAYFLIFVIVKMIVEIFFK